MVHERKFLIEKGTTQLPPAMFVELSVNNVAARAAAAAARRQAEGIDADDADDEDDADDADDEDEDADPGKDKKKDKKKDKDKDKEKWKFKKNPRSVGKCMEFVGFKLTTKFPQNICLMRDGTVVFCDRFIIPSTTSSASSSPADESTSSTPLAVRGAMYCLKILPPLIPLSI